jgi:murein DD-endopeptidase MepM/ murein hydrolase activator NlpD
MKGWSKSMRNPTWILGVRTIAMTLLAGCAAAPVPEVLAPEPPALPAPALPAPPARAAVAFLSAPTPRVPPPAPPPTLEPPRPRSEALPSGFYNPMPGGVIAGYQADTGLDIAGSPRPVYAIAAGTLDYSEPGHTLWTGPHDTANCVRFELDEPIPYKGRKITHVYYAHLSRLSTLQHEGETPRRHVEAGEMVGVSGVARHSPHLHIGLLLDGEVDQYWGTFLLADEIRRVLGGYKNGDRFPKAG